jgi:ATPase subunit of ABC transporter with duplicated ATPase domains
MLDCFTKKSNKTFLIVSHDRDFLGNVTDKIFELENNLIKSYPMGFSEYVEFKPSLLSIPGSV